MEWILKIAFEGKEKDAKEFQNYIIKFMEKHENIIPCFSSLEPANSKGKCKIYVDEEMENCKMIYKKNECKGCLNKQF